MIALVLSIATSSLIFVIFKLFDRFQIDIFQAIVINYITACLFGCVFYGNEWDFNAVQNFNWIIHAAVCAVLFIGLFFLMGKSSQLNGVGSTSVAVKMSMAVSLLLIVLIYAEKLTFLKISGIVFAFLGVYLVASPSKKTMNESIAVWMLFVLFIGSGLLDFLLNYTQKFVLGGEIPSSLFTSTGFGLAAVIGLFILTFQLFTKRSRFALKNAIAGIILGIPNYLSIYFLLQAYQTSGMEDSKVLSILNVSVVVLSTLSGIVLFKENFTIKKIGGLIVSLTAILLLYYSTV